MPSVSDICTLIASTKGTSRFFAEAGTYAHSLLAMPRYNQAGLVNQIYSLKSATDPLALYSRHRQSALLLSSALVLVWGILWIVSAYYPVNNQSKIEYRDYQQSRGRAWPIVQKDPIQGT
ncbi:hypothetical protein AG1IA_00653 [Rhizoctonia solani AG-1 IA]|uniref:Uncharacterized protein n=1 Tax=Thanatephorus cucumeris (strain AG1-IA) TaxID=983506 RepID=L8X4V1_THACA|nr:hypothetical protein AG1IA_00653 [Rhizoctonia solani AG-1 IA]